MTRNGARGLLLAVGLLFACREQPGPSGSTGSSAGGPRRIVTLAPNLTEIVFALGAGDRLVGVSEYSDYPEAARALARVGGLEVDAEKVAALHPDLVFAIQEGNAQGTVRALQAAGLPVAVTPSGSLDAVLESIRIVAGRLGRPQAGQRLVAELESRRAAVRTAVAGRRRPRALLLVWPDPPQAAGGQTFLNDVLTEAGADNLVADRRGWPVLSREYVATAPVELLVTPDSVEARAAWEAALAAGGTLSRGPIASARRVRLDEAALTRPGPRVFDMLERLAEATR
ncbi:MAG TPA: helical backbone metal receptor [Thermoanaerobaculia bacterium]